jgi:DNA repair protein RadC
MNMTENDCSTKQLLALLIGARATRQHFRGSLADLFASDAVSEATRVKLRACRELARRYALEEMHRGPVLANPSSVRDFLQAEFLGLEREVFVVIFLDNRHRVIASEQVFQGTIDGAAVHPREVVKLALARNAAAVILAHNHPSGVAEPSQADELITARIRDGLALVDIRVLDHVIVGGASVTSLAERGVL